MADTEVGSLVVKMRADLSEYIKKLEEMEKETDDKSNKVAKSLDKIGTGLAKIGVGLGTVAGLAVKSAMDWGAAVNDMVDKTGMAGEEASKLLAITNRVGVSAEETGTMFSRFSRAAYDAAQAQETMKAGGAEATDAFTTMGISVTNLDGTMKSSSALFGEIKALIADMPAGLQKTALEMEFFGRAGTKMDDMLNMTQTEMDETIKRAQDMGLIMSTEASAAWEQFSFEINTTKLSLTSLGVSVGNELLPALKSLLADAQGITQAFVSLDPETRKNIISMVSFGAEVGIAYKILGKSSGVILDVAKALGVLKASTIAAAGPWGILAFAIGTAVVALGDYKKAQMENEGQNLTIEGEDGQEYEVKNPYYKSKTDNADFSRMQNGTNNEELARLQAERLGEKYKITAATGAGGTASAGDTKTELATYLETSGRLTQLWQSQVDLNEISRAGYRALLEERLEGLKLISAGEDELMDKEQAQKSLEVQIQSISQKIREEEMADTISAQTRITSAKKDSLSQQQEAERHNLQMSETFSLDEYEAKRENWASETAFKLQNIEEVYNAESESLNATIKLYEDLRAEKGTLTREENEQYKNYLEQKRQLDSKYALNREQIENSYTERVAAQQKQIINENNDMISSLILNTKSGHDILSDMWTDFVKQTVAKLWSINSETNIFTMLLGGLFGGSGGNSGGMSNGYGYSINTGVADYSNFEFRASGGPVSANTPYIVGEQGPELFMPTYNGSIIPNSALTSGGGVQSNGTNSTSVVNVNQTFNGQQDASVVAQIKASLPYIKSEIRNAIQNETSMRNAIKGATT